MKVIKMKKLALALGSLAVLGFASQAEAVGVFTVNPLAPGVSSPTNAFLAGILGESSFQADYIGGGSSELLHNTANQSTGSGYLQFSYFNKNSSLVTGTTTGIGITYNLYLTFQLVADGPLGAPQTLSSLNFQLFLDPNKDDGFTPASLAGTGTEAMVSNRSDDALIGFGSLLGGTATLNSGGVALNALNSFALCTGTNSAIAGSTTIPGTTSDGTNTYNCQAAPTGQTSPAPGLGFFTAPNPFYQLAFSQFNNTADGVARSADGSLAAITQAGGGVSFVPVPEPETLALFGIAAVAMGVSSRRRNRKA